MKELDRVLNENEKVLWEGGPQFLPYIVTAILLAVFMMVPVLFFGYFFLAGYVGPNEVRIFIGAIPLLLILYHLLAYKFIHYAITDKRMIFQAGLIGRDFQFIDHDQITNAEVKVGLVDKLFGKDSGSIFIYSAGTFVPTKHGVAPAPYRMLNIDGPYEVFKSVKRISHDIKTDIEYPNKLRPKDNPGYESTYGSGRQ